MILYFNTYYSNNIYHNWIDKQIIFISDHYENKNIIKTLLNKMMIFIFGYENKYLIKDNNVDDYLFFYLNARGVNKDSVGGGKYFECGARSAPKFFLPPPRIFFTPP